MAKWVILCIPFIVPGLGSVRLCNFRRADSLPGKDSMHKRGTHEEMCNRKQMMMFAWKMVRPSRHKQKFFFLPPFMPDGQFTLVDIPVHIIDECKTTVLSSGPVHRHKHTRYWPERPEQLLQVSLCHIITQVGHAQAVLISTPTTRKYE